MVKISGRSVSVCTNDLTSRKMVEPGIYAARLTEDKWIVLKPTDENSMLAEYGKHINEWAQHQKGYAEIATVFIGGLE
jgi:hypothetical protein